MAIRRIIATLALAASASPTFAADRIVRSQAEFRAATAALAPGDTVVLANGVWRDFEIGFSAQGTAALPVTLRAEEPGKVILSGRSNLRIGGRFVIVSGLVFRDGYSPTGEVISFRRTDSDLAQDSRVTEVVIDRFNQPDRFRSDYWVALYGARNRFDHNHVAGKTNEGVTLAVRLETAASRGNAHRIDHNYFGPRPVLGSNGGETIRVGTSAFSMFDSNTVIEDNVFDRCDGEVEIVSIKSGANIVRRNVFLRSRGSIVLRHGDGNVVERNVFLGGGKAHTGGIRVINRRQTVRENYLEGLRGTGFASALAVMNGVPNSPVNRYAPVEAARIEHNSFIDSRRLTFAAGRSEERSAAPKSSLFADNLLQLEGGAAAIVAEDDISGLAMRGNVLAGTGPASDGIAARPVKLTRAANGLLYPGGGITAGAPRDLAVIALAEVGPTWYPKPAAEPAPRALLALSVTLADGALVKALAEAAGDRCLELAAGTYPVDRTLLVDRPICIRSAPGARATLQFTQAPLFELAPGGGLRLQRIDLRAEDPADAVGNAVIRTMTLPMPSEAVIELDQVDVRNLDVNKAFDVISIGKSAMAATIRITDSTFANISGNIVSADAERDDFGRYNAEAVEISGSRFTDVGGAIASIYRGGTDESTFGPQVRFSGNQVTHSGTTGSGLLALVGVQQLAITDNRIERSGPIRVTPTTGVPEMTMGGNVLVDSPEPVVVGASHREPRP
ncbi:polysaccharide lyase 6 family protein [Novosphingobium sp.]|uniref:polysaccharide lyase 6 family protein n=1 Tax=Novosphingobium sp. TaxID=1874826 RepID=UPI0026119BF1|nr:polysaccharide lyase 6 family protein [Novosphingobium sp.]